jgi:hypothetical protein
MDDIITTVYVSSPAYLTAFYFSPSDVENAVVNRQPPRYFALEPIPAQFVGMKRSTEQETTSVSVEDFRFSDDFLAIFGSLIQQVLGFQALGPNWDSHGAAPVDRNAMRSAILVLATLRSHLPGLPRPIVTPGPSGTVDFQWKDEDHEIWIEVGTRQHAIYVENLHDRAVLAENQFTTLTEVIQSALPFLREASA